MPNSQRQDFAAMLATLATTFNRPVTELLADAYWTALQDIPPNDLRAAVTECLRSCRFMPTPAEIREKCQPNHALAAATEWQALIASFRGHPHQLAPITQRVLKLLGGPETLGNRSPQENDTWTRREFLRLYELLANSPAAAAALTEGHHTQAPQPNVAHLIDSLASATDRNP